MIATLRAPKRTDTTGIIDENSKIPIGIMAELMPIISLETPRDSRINDSSGKVMPKVKPNTVIAAQAATTLRMLAGCGVFIARILR